MIRQRQAGRQRMDAITLQLAIASVISKKGGKRFNEFVAQMDACD